MALSFGEFFGLKKLLKKRKRFSRSLRKMTSPRHKSATGKRNSKNALLRSSSAKVAAMKQLRRKNVEPRNWSAKWASSSLRKTS